MRLSLSKLNKHLALSICCTIVAVFLSFAMITKLSIQPTTQSLHTIISNSQHLSITDRNGVALNISYQSDWNNVDYIPLYQMPDFLKSAFLMSEDRRFYTHHGIDWQARLGATWQNIKGIRTIRGASTISEQVVRMINHRPRNLWSRWLEGFEAQNLESKVNKADILEFYLNQVPYAGNRRGVAQASRYYFNRDLSTLTQKEMLALAVLVRAPSGYDLYKFPKRINAPIMRLAQYMKDQKLIDSISYETIANENISLNPSTLPIETRHFARFVKLSGNSHSNSIYHTTLDAALQKQVQSIIDIRLKSLKNNNAHNAAAIIADHQSGEVLAWVVGGADQNQQQTPAAEIDTITTPRQPGSALKPFVYALALEKGWNAATILDDSPLTKAIGSGMHNFRNYSNTYYGRVTLREALGNSLNIPALLAVSYVGVGNYLTLLQNMGFHSLAKSSNIYDEGIALGNGEVTLLEMAQAYATLANNGIYRPFRILQQDNRKINSIRVFSNESASLIGNILSDPFARRLEFGAGSVLNLPIQTAAKTGTSTDYRDAWTLAYNDKYVVGIWIGNLDNSAMREVTGSTGPALAVRSIFSILNKNRATKPLYLSPQLSQQKICIRQVSNDTNDCPKRSEWFAINSDKTNDLAQQNHFNDNSKADISDNDTNIELVRPTNDLQIAYDPRIPYTHQKFRFELRGLQAGSYVKWLLDDEVLAEGSSHYTLWPVTKGKHTLSVDIIAANGKSKTINPVNFLVK